jgi:hypothetical protein
MSTAMTACAARRRGCAMRHDPASGAVVIMLRSLKMFGMAQAVEELVDQGAPAFEAAVPMLSQLLKAEVAEREVRSIAYHMKAARFPSYKDRSLRLQERHLGHLQPVEGARLHSSEGRARNSDRVREAGASSVSRPKDGEVMLSKGRTVVRFHFVFNAEQVEGYGEPTAPEALNAVKTLDRSRGVRAANGRRDPPWRRPRLLSARRGLHPDACCLELRRHTDPLPNRELLRRAAPRARTLVRCAGPLRAPEGPAQRRRDIRHGGTRGGTRIGLSLRRPGA